jgi:hypothetical protein
MGITYRIENGQKLSVEDMDNNFHYIEDNLTGLTELINNGVDGSFNFLSLVDGVVQSTTFSFTNGILNT